MEELSAPSSVEPEASEASRYLTKPMIDRILEMRASGEIIKLVAPERHEQFREWQRLPGYDF